MAAELTVRASLSFEKGNVNGSRSKGPFTRDVAGKILHHTIQDVGFAAEEALSLGDAGVGGYIWLENLDDTNFVTVRGATAETDLIKLLPGDLALFRLTAAAAYVLADTAAVNLEIFLVKL